VSRNGATLVELIVTVTIIAIIASVTAGVIISVVQFFVYLPQEMKARSLAQDLVNIMKEGVPELKGTRYCFKVVSAGPSEFVYQTFVAGYPGQRRQIRLRLDTSTNKVYRSWIPLPEYQPPGMLPIIPIENPEVVPYTAKSPDIAVTGSSGTPSTIFRYYKADGSEWNSGTDRPADIRRMSMTIRVRTGSGLSGRWQGSFEAASSVEVKQFTELTAWFVT